MAKYSVHIWVSPARPVLYPEIEAKNLAEAWAKFSEVYGTVIDKVNPEIAWFNYQGKDGRVYRRKAKLTRL